MKSSPKGQRTKSMAEEGREKVSVCVKTRGVTGAWPGEYVHSMSSSPCPYTLCTGTERRESRGKDTKKQKIKQKHEL